MIRSPPLAPGGKPHRVAIIGSGNWGSAIARIVGANATKQPALLAPKMPMWVYEEVLGRGVLGGEYTGRKLTEVINETHVNVKYLPGVTLPKNVVAVADLAEAVRGATVLVFVIPHQFLPTVLPVVKANLAPGAVAISLIKGIEFEDGHVKLLTDAIREGLGGGVSVSVLMGANVANDVARDEFCEATIGAPAAAEGALMKAVFHTPTFQINVVSDCHSVELCGALKNVVALGAGFCDGLGYGSNTKAAIMRIGLCEMITFARLFSPEKKCSPETFFESCGMADLITTCVGGRNRRCAEVFARAKGQKSWDAIEKELLNGQKIQGVGTCEQVQKCLERAGVVKQFPLFSRIHSISFEGKPVESICDLHSAL